MYLTTTNLNIFEHNSIIQINGKHYIEHKSINQYFFLI